MEIIQSGSKRVGNYIFLFILFFPYSLLSSPILSSLFLFSSLLYKKFSNLQRTFWSVCTAHTRPINLMLTVSFLLFFSYFFFSSFLFLFSLIKFPYFPFFPSICFSSLSSFRVFFFPSFSFISFPSYHHDIATKQEIEAVAMIIWSYVW